MRHAAILAGLLALVVGSPLSALPPQDLRWHELETDHFVLLSGTMPERTQDIATALERFRASLVELMPEVGIVETAKARVYIFGSKATVHPYNLRLPNGEPGSAGGYCVRSAMGYYIGIDATPGYLWRPAVYHEYTHLLMFSRYPGLPLWLHEGIAEYFSTLLIDEGRLRVGFAPEKHLEWLREHAPPLPGQLFTMREDDPEYHEQERAGAFYAGSWLLTHYLLHDGAGSPWTLRTILALSSPDRPLNDALTARLGKVDLTSALRDYGSRKSFDSTVLVQPSTAATAASAPAPVDRASVLTRLGELLAYALGDGSAGEEHFRAALALDASRQDAAIGLAYALELQGRHDEAARLFDAAIERRPSEPGLFHVRGRAVLSAFEEALPSRFELGEAPHPRVLAARAAFERCTELAPQHADCLTGLGRTYRLAPGDVNPGIVALERACALRPHDDAPVADLAVLYARDGQGDQAERLLRALEGRTRDSKLFQHTREAVFRAEKTSVWDLVNEGRIDAAKALLGRMIVSATDLRVRRELENELAGVNYYARYAEALRLGNEGRVEEALALLTELAASEGPPDVREFVRDLLEELRQESGSGSVPP